MKTFCLYLKKLNNKQDALWQRPKDKNFNKNDPEWYENSPVGRDPLNDAMKNLSKKAKLSRLYTNHCIRASVVTSLDEKGFEARHIMATTGHKSEASIKSYAARCPDNKRRQVSEALASNLIDEPNNKVARLSPKRKKSTAMMAIPQEVPAVKTPQNDNPEQLALEYPGYEENKTGDFELFPNFDDISDDMLVNTLTQIEKENAQVVQPNVIVTKESATTLNVSSVQNIPKLPTMYFPHSSVTINYHFHK